MQLLTIQPGVKAEYWRYSYTGLEVIPVEVLAKAKVVRGLQMWKVKILNPDERTRRQVLVVSGGSLHISEED